MRKRTIQRRYGLFGVLAVLFGVLILADPVRAAAPTAIQLRTEINRVRQTNHVRVLKNSYTLNRVALRRVQDMSRYRFFGHTSPLGRTYGTYLALGPARFRASGEVIGLNQRTATTAVANWQKSPEHRAIIRHSSYTHIGAAVGWGVIRGKRVTLLVVLFGR